LIAAIVSAALIVAASLAVGQAVLAVCGRRDPTWLAGPIGLALLLVVAGIVASAGGRGPAVAVGLGIVLVLAVVAIAATGWRGGIGGATRFVAPVAAAALAALFASIPFIAAGNVGILGVGLVNDDMASHLLLADWVREHFRPEPVLVDQGYPLGPHGLVAGIGELLGASSIDVFAGLTVAIPALSALVAYAALDGLRTAARVGAAALVALPYMAAAYLAQEAFKEPIIALFVLTFALLLPKLTEARHAIPLGVIAAGTIYVYSFPGLAWLAGTAAVWGAIELVRRGSGDGREAIRSKARTASRAVFPTLALAAGTLVVLTAPEIGRLLDFADFRALHPDRANEGGLGNLPGQLNPLEAFGIWPTSEFRLTAGENALPAIAFYAGALAAIAGFALAVGRWVREQGVAIVAGLLSAAILYLLARAFGTVYTSAKALAIAAPFITLITLGGLFAARSRGFRLLGVGIAFAAAASSFLILREAPVAPDDHMEELAEIRPLVAGEKLLFLGRDNFVVYELRGSKPFVAVRNFYDPYYAEPNTELADVFAKFDFDSVDAETLAEFPYVLTTRAAYASGPPPSYEAVRQTDSYVLWKRRGADSGRVPAERDAAPGRVIDCDRGEAPAGRAAFFAQPPVVADGAAWSQRTINDGESASVELTLPRGSWRISLQYDASRPVTVGANGTELAELPGNLDFRGPGPYWPAGAVRTSARRTQVVIDASVERPPLAGRLLGADSVAHLGPIAASPAGAGYVADGEEPLPGTGELLRPAAEACGRYVDWFRGR
jgi:hypothetical protein